MARTPNPASRKNLPSLRCDYDSTKETPLDELVQEGRQARSDRRSNGSSAVAFDCMRILNINGALVWTSVTGGQKKTEVPSDGINLEWVLGTSSWSAPSTETATTFEGLGRSSLGEVMFPESTERILTDPRRRAVILRRS